MTLILSNDDVEQLLSMRECIDALEDAYAELAEGRGISRLRSDSFAPTSRKDALYSLKSMDGICPKLGVGAVRINSDIVTWPEDGGNARRVKVPAAPNQRYVGLVLLFSVENGEPLAIMPDGVMQRMRVGAANGLGVKHLARKDARHVGILGSGWQAGAQLMAVTTVRDIETIRCFSPTRDQPRSLLHGDERQARSQGHPRRTPRGRDQGRRHRDVRQQHDRSHLLRALDRARHAHHLDQAPGDRDRRAQALRGSRAAQPRSRAAAPLHQGRRRARSRDRPRLEGGERA